nr:MAG TPA: hypothetical protein [Microviridae sp.]
MVISKNQCYFSIFQYDFFIILINTDLFNF